MKSLLRNPKRGWKLKLFETDFNRTFMFYMHPVFTDKNLSKLHFKLAKVLCMDVFDSQISISKLYTTNVTPLNSKQTCFLFIPVLQWIGCSIRSMLFALFTAFNLLKWIKDSRRTLTDIITCIKFNFFLFIYTTPWFHWIIYTFKIVYAPLHGSYRCQVLFLPFFVKLFWLFHLFQNRWKFNFDIFEFFFGHSLCLWLDRCSGFHGTVNTIRTSASKKQGPCQRVETNSFCSHLLLNSVTQHKVSLRSQTHAVSILH